jgi:hypothetical protein
MQRKTFLIKLVLLFIFTVGYSLTALSQALLPNITITNQGGKNHISWRSGYDHIKLIGIQRSRDSLVNYATIGHASDPNKKTNTYIDKKPFSGKNFYRLFIVLTNGSYFFSNPAGITLTPATLSTTNSNRPMAFQPSIFVYTNPDGNVNISLAHASTNQYSIRFFDDQDHFLFEITDIKKPFLILDKSNFLRSGWYHFELYENGKIKEKWKFYIADPIKNKSLQVPMGYK